MTGSESSDNADVKWRENNAEGEDSSRTANCLRGRLLAERMASKNAREQAEQLGIRLLEVEGLLKQEVKSRNKAEKKVKLLMKRLECMNISYVPNESEKLLVSPEGSLNSSTSSFELKKDECGLESNQNSKHSEVDDEQRMESSIEEDDRYSSEHADSSMAIVPVNVEAEDRRIEPEVLDATVKEVLESLRRAKEQLQISMEKRRMSMSMIKVG